jgi:hypothetical protein
MRIVLLMILLPLVIGFGVVRAALVAMAQEEVRTRLEQIPAALLRLASTRVPAELREDQVAEWNAELEHIVAHRDGLPLTRLVEGIRFAAGILTRAPDIVSDLSGIRKLGKAAATVTAGALIAAVGLIGAVGSLWLAGVHGHGTVVLAGQVCVGLSWFTMGALIAAKKTATSWWWLAGAGLSAGNFAMAAGADRVLHICFGVSFGCLLGYVIRKERRLKRRITNLNALVDRGDFDAFKREHDALFPGCTKCAEYLPAGSLPSKRWIQEII